jgi:hypothetical protein
VRRIGLASVLMETEWEDEAEEDMEAGIIKRK